jgi:hypothetical protein
MASVTEDVKANQMIPVAQQREIAEVQAAMLIARMNPRNEKAALNRILDACTRPSLAESALYSYNRGGTEITGPSIRLAEVLAQNWQNMDFGIRELEQRDGESTVEAFCWDVQNNVRQRKVFQVAHIRVSKSKGYVSLTDPRDIYEMVANQGARRLRACILGVVPGDVIESAVKQCETTLHAKGKITSDRLKSLVDKFTELGVTKEMIEKRIQRHLEAMTPTLFVQLGKIYNSLKDGMSVTADWFSPGTAGPEKGTLNVEDLKPAAEANRGHGDDRLDEVPKKENTAENQALFLCEKKRIPVEALRAKLGQMGIEETKEIEHKHMKELIEWATTWRASGKKAAPVQKNLTKSDYDDSE